MPEKLIMVRESEWREMRETLAKCAEGWGNAVEFDLLPPSHHAAATYLRDEARAALAKSEATAVQPAAHAYVVAGECEQIEWGTDVDLPVDPALVWLYAHPTPDGCGRKGKHALTDIMEDAKEDTLRRHPARCGPFVIEDGDLEGGDDG